MMPCVGATGSGAVLVLKRVGNAWQPAMTGGVLACPSPQVNGRFGTAVAVEGDRLVVGEPGADNGAGRAWIFLRTPVAWVLETELICPDVVPGSEYGFAVDVHRGSPRDAADRNGSPALGVRSERPRVRPRCAVSRNRRDKSYGWTSLNRSRSCSAETSASRRPR